MKMHPLFPSLVAAMVIAAFSPTAFPNKNEKPTLENLTLRIVQIDPLGADPETPWTVHSGSLNIREKPSTDSPRIGTVGSGDQISGDYLIVEESDEEWLRIDFNGQDGFVSRLGFSRVHPRNRELIEQHGNLPFGEEIVNRWWGIPLDYEADDLVEIPEAYHRQRENRNYRLRREAMESLSEMIDAMRADGLALFVSSPYRSGSQQTSIFRSRMRADLAQRRSAPPGHSEHQLGTTVDLAPELTGRTLRNSDPQHAWLKENGAQYGWRQTYLADNTEETGYIEEPWHWRYIGREKLAAAKQENVILEILNSEGHVEAAFKMDAAEAFKDFDAFIEYNAIDTIQYPLPDNPEISDQPNRAGIGTSISVSDFVSNGELVSFSLKVQEHLFERFETNRTPSRVLRFPILKKYQFEGKISLQPNEPVTFGEMPDRKPWSARAVASPPSAAL